MADNANQLIFEIHKGQSQFAYFQLGVAASAIAFAIHETTGLPLSQAPWPLGAAVALWALSFALGCFGIDARQDGLHTNALFLQIFGDVLHMPMDSSAKSTIESAKEAVKVDLRKPLVLFGCQKWALFAGALFYIAGHIMQMAAIPSVTPPSSTAAITSSVRSNVTHAHVNGKHVSPKPTAPQQ